MPKSLDYREFIKWLKQKGKQYEVRYTTNHAKVVDKRNDSVIVHFPIHHSKGSKPQVLGVYIKQIEDAIQRYEGL